MLGNLNDPATKQGLSLSCGPCLAPWVIPADSAVFCLCTFFSQHVDLSHWPCPHSICWPDHELLQGGRQLAFMSQTSHPASGAASVPCRCRVTEQVHLAIGEMCLPSCLGDWGTAAPATQSQINRGAGRCHGTEEGEEEELLRLNPWKYPGYPGVFLIGSRCYEKLINHL